MNIKITWKCSMRSPAYIDGVAYVEEYEETENPEEHSFLIVYNEGSGRRIPADLVKEIRILKEK